MHCQLECKSFPFNTLGDYKWVDIISFHKGKWIFSQHKERTTWETQGGHIEVGEAPLDAAKRELYEESGAIVFDIEPLCDYSAKGTINGKYVQANSQVFVAQVHQLGEIPWDSEMAQIALFDVVPDNLTYVDIMSEILPLVMKKLREEE